jgi:hypothetical protein
MSLHWVLLLGVALNWYGAIMGLLSASKTIGTFDAPSDYWLSRLFLAGTAATFGTMYLYLWFHPEYVWPFLAFGAALKTWAFLIAAYLSSKGIIGKPLFVQFGVSNGIVALLFWAYLATLA